MSKILCSLGIHNFTKWVDAELVKTKRFGKNASDTVAKAEREAKQHQNYSTLSVISILVPLIGLFIGAIYITKDDELDRKLGEHLIAWSILWMIIWGVVILIYGSLVSTQIVIDRL